jgi:ribosome-binding factor A
VKRQRRSGSKTAPTTPVEAGGGHRRVDRVAGEIEKVLSSLLLHRIRDPRVSHVTVTAVKVTPDLRMAKVFFTLLDVGTGDREEALRGLMSAVPFFRRHLAAELDLRYTPELVFAYDDALEGARHVDSLLRGLRRDGDDTGNAGEDEGT